MDDNTSKLDSNATLRDLFPDAGLCRAMKAKLGKKASFTGEELLKSLSRIKVLDIYNEAVCDTTGIEWLTGLTSLCISPGEFDSIDVSKNLSLKMLGIERCGLTHLNVSKNVNLTTLYVGWNKLTALDISNNAKLQGLSIIDNQLSHIDISNNASLQALIASGNRLTHIDTSANLDLRVLDVADNQLTDINISKNTLLSSLNVEQNKLKVIDVSNNPTLHSLYVCDNSISSIDLDKNSALRHLKVANNHLTSLNIRKSTALEDLDVSGNRLSHLDLSNNENLVGIVAHGQGQANTISLSAKVNNWRILAAGDGDVGEAYNEVSKWHKWQWDTDNTFEAPQRDIDVEDSDITLEEIFPDTILRRIVSERLGHNVGLKGNDLINALAHITHDIYSLNAGIKDASGIEYLTGITELNFGNNEIEYIDISNNVKLRCVYLGSNKLTSLDVSKNVELYMLSLENNKLTSLDISKNPELVYLSIDGNSMSVAVNNGNSKLEYMATSQDEDGTYWIGNKEPDRIGYKLYLTRLVQFTDNGNGKLPVQKIGTKNQSTTKPIEAEAYFSFERGLGFHIINGRLGSKANYCAVVTHIDSKKSFNYDVDYPYGRLITATKEENSKYELLRSYIYNVKGGDYVTIGGKFQGYNESLDIFRTGVVHIGFQNDAVIQQLIAMLLLEGDFNVVISDGKNNYSFSFSADGFAHFYDVIKHTYSPVIEVGKRKTNFVTKLDNTRWLLGKIVLSLIPDNFYYFAHDSYLHHFGYDFPKHEFEFYISANNFETVKSVTIANSTAQYAIKKLTGSSWITRTISDKEDVDRVLDIILAGGKITITITDAAKQQHIIDFNADEFAEDYKKYDLVRSLLMSN